MSVLIASIDYFDLVYLETEGLESSVKILVIKMYLLL